MRIVVTFLLVAACFCQSDAKKEELKKLLEPASEKELQEAVKSLLGEKGEVMKAKLNNVLDGNSIKVKFDEKTEKQLPKGVKIEADKTVIVYLLFVEAPDPSCQGLACGAGGTCPRVCMRGDCSKGKCDRCGCPTCKKTAAVREKLGKEVDTFEWGKKADNALQKELQETELILMHMGQSILGGLPAFVYAKKGDKLKNMSGAMVEKGYAVPKIPKILEKKLGELFDTGLEDAQKKRLGLWADKDFRKLNGFGD